MKTLNQKEIDAVLQLSSEERYKYFIKSIADSETVFGLYHEGWALYVDGEGNTFFPFWSHSVYAELCKEGIWRNYDAEEIELSEFLDFWIPGIKDDGLLVIIFPTPKDKGISIDLESLELDIIKELNNYS